MSGVASGISNIYQGANTASGAVEAENAELAAERMGESKLTSVYDTSTGRYIPYSELGANAVKYLGENIGPNGSLGRAFTMADFNMDPAYQFSVRQGLNAINNANSVRGGSLSGGALKGLEKYGVNMANEQYNTAESRFKANQMQDYGQYLNAANTGLSATNSLAQLGQNYAHDYMGQMNTMGNTQASGIMGRVSGENQMIGGTMSTIGSLATMGMGK